jgi:hypothetical protein
MPVDPYREACVVILPSRGPSRQLVDALLKLLKSPEEPPLLVVGRSSKAASTMTGARELIGTATGAQGALIQIGTKIADRVIDGATVVIRDQYRDDRSAKRWYDQQATRYLTQLRRDVYGLPAARVPKPNPTRTAAPPSKAGGHTRTR